MEERKSKGEKSSWPVLTSLFALHSLEPSEMFTELHREQKREERDRGGQRGKGSMKRRETDPASSQPMSKEGWLPQEGLEELSHVEGQEGWW